MGRTTQGAEGVGGQRWELEGGGEHRPELPKAGLSNDLGCQGAAAAAVPGSSTISTPEGSPSCFVLLVSCSVLSNLTIVVGVAESHHTSQCNS
jgi:hypothetical protein